jgi:ferredoxin--NADP+ reductase
MGTGTGLAPFMSIVQDPEVYELYEKIILVHGCREVQELAYQERLGVELPGNEFFGDVVSDKLVYYPTVTREAFRNQGRITDLIRSNELFENLHLPPLNLEEDRVMLCGSPAMLKETQALLEERGLTEGNMSRPGHYVIERAFVEK